MCTAAFSAPLAMGAPLVPALTLRAKTYEEGGWMLNPLGEALEAPSADAVHTVVCIAEARENAGWYTDGQPAFKRIWHVRFVRWPEGNAFGIGKFVGGDPPDNKASKGPGYGTTPQDELSKWLTALSDGETILVPNARNSRLFSVHSLAFSPDGGTLFVGSNDLVVRLWDLAGGQEARTFTAEGRFLVDSVALSPDGRTLAAGISDRTVLWDVATGQVVGTLQGAGSASLAFSPDGQILASGAVVGVVKLWDVATGEVISSSKEHTGHVLGLAFSPDGGTLASAGGSDGTVKLWDVAAGQVVSTLDKHTGWVFSVAFSPDGRALASGSGGDGVRLWDVTTGQEMGVFPYRGAVYSVVFLPDGGTLASGNENGTLTLWDVATGQAVRTLRGHGSAVKSLACSPDGQTLASGSADGTLRFWDVTAQGG
jgi:WD40 repeat protein